MGGGLIEGRILFIATPMTNCCYGLFHRRSFGRARVSQIGRDVGCSRRLAVSQWPAEPA